MQKGNGSYITVEKWMAQKLDLRGNELLVYAVIYGFSQDGESKYYGSRRYISEFLNMSLSTVDRILANLVKDKLITKEVETKNGINFNSYRVNFTF